METLLFSITHPVIDVLRPIRTLFFNQKSFLKLNRNVLTLLQHLENTPANCGSVVRRAQVLLLTTWTEFYYRQKIEIEWHAAYSLTTALRFKQKQSCCDGSLVDRCIFLRAKTTGSIKPGWCLCECGAEFPSSSTVKKMNLLFF